jgi:putative NIF3 family GTP cyclohydrolase 1 type 2
MDPEAVRAVDVQELLRSLWQGRAPPQGGVDRIVAGDPECRATGVAVMWMAYRSALERAVELGCNVIVTHEPTFYDHHDEDPASLSLGASQSKRALIDRHALTVMRCHDLWDAMPERGVPDAWGRRLGLGAPVAATEFLRVYEVRETTALELAMDVARAVRPLGQEAVQLLGDEEARVRRIGIGTGAITPYRRMTVDLGVDAAICTDDGIDYWRDGALAIDGGVPLIVVNHPVAEEDGIVSLAETLREALAPLPVHHLPQRCMFRLVSA